MKWRGAPLSYVAKVIRGVSFDSSETSPEPRPDHLPILRAGNIARTLDTENDLVWVPKARVSDDQRLRPGDIAIAMSSGSADVVGKTAPLTHEWEGSVGAFCAIIRPRRLIQEGYLAHWLLGPEFTSWRQSQCMGLNIKNLRKAELERLAVPLPTPSEQRRIVEILDQADALRKKRAEADTKAARILPALFYKIFGDPLALVTSGQGIPLEDLDVDIQNGFACGEKEVERGVPHLRMNNIDDAGVLNLELVRTVPLDRDVERYRLAEKDVLFMGTNSEDKVGKTCLFLPPDDRTYLFSNHLVRIRVSDSRITAEFLAAFLHLLWAKRFFPSIAKRWVNQSSVPVSSLSAVQVPLPKTKPLECFSRAYADLLRLRHHRKESRERIDQGFRVLLHRAFTGDLTAKWGEAHMKELLAEMEAQAKALESQDDETGDADERPRRRRGRKE